MRARGTTRLTGIIAVVAAIAAVAIHVSFASADPLQQNPVTANATLTFTTTTDSLAAGQAIGYHVDTNSGTTLNSVEAKICTDGNTTGTWGSGTFGYSGTFGTRCVFAAGITSGALTGTMAQA